MYTLKIIDSIRQQTIAAVKDRSNEQLNKIPEGFNNNIAWNFGHIIISGYSLVYKVTGVDPDFVIPYFEKYRKGSKPESPVTPEEIAALIELSNTFTRSVHEALNAGRFTDISEYTTGTFGLPITAIEEMLITVACHDTLHWQTIRDYKRILDL